MWERAFISSLSFHLWVVSSSPRSWSETMEGTKDMGSGQKGLLPEETAHWSWRNLRMSLMAREDEYAHGLIHEEM